MKKILLTLSAFILLLTGCSDKAPTPENKAKMEAAHQKAYLQMKLNNSQVPRTAFR